MKGKFGVAGLVACAALLLSLSSCAHNQHLIAIQVEPPGATMGPEAQVQFLALGTYIHPPATKEITNLVQWSIDNQDFGTVSAGLVTAAPGSQCDTANLLASFYDSPNEVIGTASLTGSLAGTSACNQAVISVKVSGSGTVTSIPRGIDSAIRRSSPFTLGETVAVSAKPSGNASAVTWSGCDSVVGNECRVQLTSDRTVTAAFE